MYTMQRTQLYLDEADTAVIDAQARETGTTRSEIIRSLIAEHVAGRRGSERDLVERQKRALLSLADIDRDLRPDLEALREADRARADEHDERWEASA